MTQEWRIIPFSVNPSVLLAARTLFGCRPNRYREPMTDDMTPQQRAAETKRKRTREWIITSTLDLYGELNQGDFTREQIAEAAGVGLTTLSNHFRLKYEALRAAHDRLISPIIEPLSQGIENQTYKPDDAVSELLRYFYAVAKISHQHRALTVAMIRAYYETPPEQRYELHRRGDLSWSPNYNMLLGGYIAKGIWPILHSAPFKVGAWYRITGDTPSSHAEDESVLYHANAFLTELYHQPQEDAPDTVTRKVCRELLAVALPDINMKDALRKLEDVKPSVDYWLERRNQQGDMWGR